MSESRDPLNPPARGSTGGAESATVVRDAAASDLPRVHRWLGPLAARDLPPGSGIEHGHPGAASAERWLAGASSAERWLVAEQAGQVQAALRVRPAIGLDVPRAWYHLGCVVHASAALRLFNRQPRLLLGNDLCGAAELADLVWARDADAPADPAPVLTALVRAALDWLASPAHAAAEGTRPLVLVELPGLQGTSAEDAPEGADSPFWAGLGRAFCRTHPHQAATRLGTAWHGHVAALLPRQPVYLSFLPSAAQAAVGQVDPAAAPLLAVLQAAGFAAGEHLTVHDGGPVWQRALPR